MSENSVSFKTVSETVTVKIGETNQPIEVLYHYRNNLYDVSAYTDRTGTIVQEIINNQAPATGIADIRYNLTKIIHHRFLLVGTGVVNEVLDTIPETNRLTFYEVIAGNSLYAVLAEQFEQAKERIHILLPPQHIPSVVPSNYYQDIARRTKED